MKWVDRRKVNSLKGEEKEAYAKWYILFKGGKSMDISVLIPKTMQSALDILTDREVRASCGVEDGNPFTFPSIGSQNHCSGTAEFREMRGSWALTAS